MRYCDNIHRYLDGELTCDDAVQFMSHLDNCPACSDDLAFLDLAREVGTARWGLTVGAPDAPAVSTLLEQATLEQDREVARRRYRRVWLAVASITLFLAVGALFAGYGAEHTGGVATGASFNQRSLIPSTRVEGGEARGGVLLPEGITERPHRIWTGPESRVFAVSDDAALLDIESGSVVVHTVPDAPSLTIYAGPYVISDIGTTFEVRYDPARGLDVTVARGRVSVDGFGDVPVRIEAEQSLTIVPEDGFMALSVDDTAAARLDEMLGDSASDEALLRPPAVATSKGRLSVQGPAPPLDAWRKMVLSGRYAEAEDEMTAYLARDSRNADVWSMLGDCRRKASDWRGAVSAYEQVLRYGSGVGARRAAVLMGEVYQDELGELDRAAAAYERCLERGDGGRLRGTVLLKLARVRQAQKKTDKAIKALEEILEGPFDESLKQRAEELKRTL